MVRLSQSLKCRRADLYIDTNIPLLELFPHLLSTYPRYQDRQSRKAVRRCLVSYLQNPECSQDALNIISEFLKVESQKEVVAPQNAFVLLEWSNILLQELSSTSNVSISRISKTCSSAAASMEKCLRPEVRVGLKKSSVGIARRGLKNAFNSPKVKLVFSEILKGLICGPLARVENAPYLGLVAGLSAKQESLRVLMKAHNLEVLSFYTKFVLGSRSIIPQHLANGLRDFFRHFVTHDDLVQDVIPALEKAILRAPEVALQGVIPCLAQSLDDSIDLSNILSARLAQPLISAFKSSNVSVREGAGQAVAVLLSRCHQPDILIRISNEFLSAIGSSKGTSNDFRSLVAGGLENVIPSQEASPTIVKGLTPIAIKEANEGSLRTEVSAICRHLPPFLTFMSTEDQNLLGSILKACQENRTGARKIWLIALAGAFTKMDCIPDNATARSFVDAILELLLNASEEVWASPIPAAQSGLATTAFAFLTIVKSETFRQSSSIIQKATSVVKEALSLKPKASFLLNPRVYSRLTTVEESEWVFSALISLIPDLKNSNAEVRAAWAQGIIFLLTSPNISPQIRRRSHDGLSNAYLQAPGIVGSSITSGIWQWLHEVEKANKESAALMSKAGLVNLRRCIACITPVKQSWARAGIAFPGDILEQQAIDTVLIYSPALIPGSDWIASCLRTGVDPGRVVSDNRKKLLDDILDQFQATDNVRWIAMELAARNATGTLAFVSPDSMTPLIIQSFSQDLDVDQLSGIGATEIAIAQTPEGVVFVDVLNDKTNNLLENKNIKDYDVLKWEEELRLQLSQKKGSRTKLSADQQARVNAQLSREVEIRQKILNVKRNVRRGAALVQGIAEGPPTDARAWMTPALTALLGTLRAGAALLGEHGLIHAYLACARRVAARLGVLRESIGVATLRSLGNLQLPPEYQVEPLGDLVTRVLYRLRFAAEQWPFDAVSFSYMLPLILRVLEKGPIGQSSAEDSETQILLALEFLSFHMSICSDAYLPRIEILSQIISSLKRYTQHYRLLKEILLDLCRSIAPNIQPAERDMLLRALTSSEPGIRSAVLQALHSELDLSTLDYSEFIWLACYDCEEDNADTAMAIWDENAMSVSRTLISQLPQFLRLSDQQLRISAGKALAGALDALPALFSTTVETLKHTYCREAQPPVPKRDKYGIFQKADLTDHWEARSGLAIAFRSLTSLFPPSELIPFLEFLIKEGCLMDRHVTVRKEMLDAGTALVALRGAECLEPLMNLLENHLGASSQDTQEADWLNEALIILYGSLARHLPPGDPRVQTVITKLIATLKTPSEQVQYAVAHCLAPLCWIDNNEARYYVTQLLEELFAAKQYASRRGAAYGLAGIVQGCGISALRQFRIMVTLKHAAENKKSTEHRQGALFAIETLSTILGRNFEPYMIEALPQLLACFGDPSPVVRDACLDAAKSCFSSLSSFGVHRVLPRLLEGLAETQWRSKKGACELLGAMAYLDPQQLANSLPDIIPPLTAVLNDSHKEVRAAANASLQRFGEVISNPEVKSLVNLLLKALSDPTKYTEDALDGLIKVSFVHYLDAPSLALVVRILERGLGDRSSTKRKSAQIIGSLAHLTEKKDLTVHLPILVSGLRAASVDPVPATRATASKALGSLVEKLGEDSFPDLIPSLMSSLRTDTGAGDRLGSAQALSEVLAGLGTSRLEDTLPTILQNVSSTRPSVREGFMTLFIFLPACFGNSFSAYLSHIIPSILGGLADEVEAIREISLRAGRLLVKNFATKSIDLLLPELQRGLADWNHRIRLSSVELVGDLLFSLTGVSQKTETEEEVETAAQAGQSLLEVLGEERRNKVLSSLYICRCDTSGLVRSAAIAVWKALVSTPRTLRELVPTLTEMIINRLASSSMEQKVIAGNALGEVVRKAGEGVFVSLLPFLEQGLENSTDANYRQGICIALREVVNAAQSETLEEHERKLISIVRLALVDSNADVRDAAAESFDALQHIFGKKAVDHVLPHLLNLLRDEREAENALSALLTLLTDPIRANVILPNLIPTLLTSPISSFNARALSSLAKVGGASMNRRLPIILNSLCDNIVACKDPELKRDLDDAFNIVLVSVDEFDGLNTSMSVMLAMMKHEDHRKRAVAAYHLGMFFSAATVDYSRYNQDLIRVLLISFDDRAEEVVRAAWLAMSQLQARLRKEEMESLVISTRQVLLQVGVAGSNLPGFAIPKGMFPVLQIFLQGLMNGTTEQRIQAALGIADIIDRSSGESLKPFVTQITGPLIRVVGERSVEVKSAILFTLNQLLEKIPTFLRPFLPQLQRTFTKSIADPASDVLRGRATKALSTLITLTPRVDPLIAELVTGSKTTDQGVKNAMLKALQEVVSKVGASMSDASKDSILGLIDSQHDVRDDNSMMTNARLLGAMIKVLPFESASALMKARILVQPSTNASILTLNAVLLESSESVTTEFLSDAVNVICQGITGKNIFIQHNAILASGKLLLIQGVIDNANTTRPVITALGSAVAPGGDIDTRRLALVVLRTLSRHHVDVIHTYVTDLAPSIFASVRDPVIPVKLAAEAAFLELFSVADTESAVFDAYINDDAGGRTLPAGTHRSMSDYFKRVALRLGAQARERKEAEGGAGGLGLASDEAEDEREIWSVGRTEVGGDVFAQE